MVCYKREKVDNNALVTVAVLLIGALTISFMFIRKAIEQKKVVELFISVPLLICTYWVMYEMAVRTLWCWLIPFALFAIYWAYLFSLKVEEEITNPSPNPCWANRNWWWTLDGWSFEEEVAEIFRLNGYDVEVTKKTGDGGVDLILWKDDMKTIVQCKHYSAPIQVGFVRELNGVREDYRAQRVIMVASSGCTSQGYQFIKNKPYYTILDLDDIIEMGLRPNSRRFL